MMGAGPAAAMMSAAACYAIRFRQQYLAVFWPCLVEARIERASIETGMRAWFMHAHLSTV